MKRFTISVLCVSVFFIGLGSMADRVGAKFKSDEKALSIIRQARQAIGGDQAVAAVRSMTISGKTTKFINTADQQRAEPGESEIAFDLSGKFSKLLKVGTRSLADGDGQTVEKTVNVVVLDKSEAGDSVKFEGKDGEFTTTDGKKVVVRKIEKQDGATAGAVGDKIIVREVAVPEGAGPGEHKIVIRKSGDGNATWQTENGDVVHARSLKGAHEDTRQNELLSTTFALLLTAPDGMDVNYTFSGESVVDGIQCNIVTAEFGGAAYRLYIGKSSNLPVMMSYAGVKMPQMIKMKMEAPKAGEPQKDKMTFIRTPGPAGEKAEFQVRFSDYRNVEGVLLPFRWVRSVNGQQDETLEVSNYVLNPVNIAEKFQNEKVFVRTKKAEH